MIPSNNISTAIIAPNTPRGLATDDISAAPSSYSLVSAVLKTQSGGVYDLRRILVSFTITEEIFTPVVVFVGSIRDDVNFFNSFVQIETQRAQERLEIELLKTDPASDGTSSRTTQVKLDFMVKEYPNYSKELETMNVQEFSIIAVSECAYLSSLQRMSESTRGNPAESVKRIFSEKLNINRVGIDTRPEFAPVTPFDGVITLQSPLRAIEWLRQKMFDIEGSPFFLYTSLRDNTRIHGRSWRALIDDSAPPYPGQDQPYTYKPLVEGDPNEPAAYAESVLRILSLSSNIRIDKLKQIKDGAFGSKIEITDLRQKSFIEKITFQDRDARVRAARSRRAEETLSDETDEWAKAVNFISNGASSVADVPQANASVSRIPGDASARNSSAVLIENIENAKRWFAYIDSMTHEIEVNGDLRLNPGRKIQVRIPKSVEPNAAGIPQASVDDQLDNTMSGEYIVATAVHDFADGEYKTRTRIIKIL